MESGGGRESVVLAPCLPSSPPHSGALLRLGMTISALLRALRQPSPQATLQLAMGANIQAVTGYRHLNRRNLSVLNGFSKQLTGEAKSNPKFEKSMKELNEKLGSVVEDLKVSTKKTTEKIYKSVDDVWTEAEATSKKVKGTFQLRKEEISKDGSPKSSTHEKTKASSHPNGETQDAACSATLFSILKLTVSSASPAVSSAFAKLKDTRVSTLAKQGYDIVKDELRSGRNKKIISGILLLHQ